ncbi:MAG: hypothetical protein WHS46_14785 [Desulfosoma sp.]
MAIFSALPQVLGKNNPSKVTMVEVVRAKFGSGPNDIGVITPSEANPEGPMSFALGANGEIFILDQTNSRIQVFKGGKRIRTISMPLKTLWDIDVLSDARIREVCWIELSCGRGDPALNRRRCPVSAICPNHQLSSGRKVLMSGIIELFSGILRPRST